MSKLDYKQCKALTGSLNKKVLSCDNVDKVMECIRADLCSMPCQWVKFQKVIDLGIINNDDYRLYAWQSTFVLLLNETYNPNI